MSKHVYKGVVSRGLVVAGDKSVPPTRWWNNNWLVNVAHKKHAVLTYLGPRSYQLGYRNSRGVNMLYDRKIESREYQIRIPIGHEDRMFFAIDSLGNEIELLFDGLFDKDSPRIANLPIL